MPKAGCSIEYPRKNIYNSDDVRLQKKILLPHLYLYIIMLLNSSSLLYLYLIVRLISL